MARELPDPRVQHGVSRRTLLAGAGMLVGAGATCGTSGSAAESMRQVMADVVVVGGGTGGTVAAIQAGRLGAKTLLVESGSQLGGTMTTGGVTFPGLFCAWGRQIIAGIGWELVHATAQLQGDPLPDFSQSVWPALQQHPRFQVRISGGLYAALAEEACVEAGVALRYYEFPLAAQRAADGWVLRLAGKGTQVAVHCRQLIDCTGNASVVALAGLPRLREEETQPGSIVFTLSPPGRSELYVLGADSSTSESHSAANIEGRKRFLEHFRALRSREEGQPVKLADLRPETAVRETYRIVGQTTISKDDFESGRRFADAVAYAYYPIDLHTSAGVRPQHLQEGTVPTIPLGALVPQGSEHLLVAGRCVSSDRLANSALRVQASCMAMGQAAGAAAVLAHRLGVTPAAVPLDAIRRTLQEHAAIVPEP